MFAGRFEYLAPDRGPIRSGDCQFAFDERTATIAGGGASMAFDLGDVEACESNDFQIRLALFTGHAVILTRFGKAFSDMERQLREAYRSRLVQCLLVSDLDEVARFTGRVHLDSSARSCDGPAELRLYESNLAVLPDVGTGFQWRLADIDAVEFDERDYAVAITSGAERLAAGRLAKRTGELADRLGSRIAALRDRSARALHRVFPFLDPEAFARLAAAMPEGRSASVADVGRLHRLVEPTLLGSVVDAALTPHVQALARRAAGPWFAGFKIIRQEPAAADEPVADYADGAEATPPADDVVGERLAAGDGLELLFWFFFPLAAPGARDATHVAWEATSRGGRATYLFRLPLGEPVASAVNAINQGLLAVNFRREPVYLDAARLESDHRYRHYAIAARRMPELRRIREAFAGRVVHTTPDAWSTRLDALLAG